MSQKLCLFKTPAFLNKICSRLKYRVLVLPLLFIGMLGFAVNHSIIAFTYSTMDYCRPKTNIVFLKTHKCAGSTIQNILMRYGDVHNLTFVLPHTGNYLGLGRHFDKTFVDMPRFPVYNILAHHTRLNYKAIKKFMPSNSIFITIVRNPVKLFESSFGYYSMHRFYGLDIHNFSQLSPIHNQTFLRQRLNYRIGINQMMFDLGVNPHVFYNHSFIEHYVDNLESQFHLVLVAERMDESLILLKNLLCWDVNDVVAFKVNARNPEFKRNLTEDEIKNLELINNADMVLYKRFLHRFERQVKNFGASRMKQEISELKAMRKMWSDLCIQEVQKKAKLQEVQEKAKLQEVQEKSKLQEVQEKAKLQEVQEKAKLQEVQEKAKLQEVQEKAKLQEVQEKAKLQKVQKKANHQEVQKKATPVISKEYVNPYVMRFEPRKDVDNATCVSLIKEELSYTEFLRKKQRLRLPAVKPRRYLARKPKLSKKIRRRRLEHVF